MAYAFAICMTIILVHYQSVVHSRVVFGGCNTTLGVGPYHIISYYYINHIFINLGEIQNIFFIVTYQNILMFTINHENRLFYQYHRSDVIKRIRDDNRLNRQSNVMYSLQLLGPNYQIYNIIKNFSLCVTFF